MLLAEETQMGENSSSKSKKNTPFSIYYFIGLNHYQTTLYK